MQMKGLEVGAEFTMDNIGNTSTPQKIQNCTRKMSTITYDLAIHR